MNTRLLRSANLAYSLKCRDSALVAATGKQLKLYSCRLLNRSGGAADLGIGRFLNASKWTIGQYAEVAQTFTDVTAPIAAGTATTIIDTTVNDGFIVSAKERFGLIVFTVSQAETGSPVYEYKYWNGTAWTALSTINLPTAYPTGEIAVAFSPPYDWVVGGTAIAGLDLTKFNIRVRATTHTTANVQVTAAAVAAFFDFQSAVADKGSFSWAVTNIDIPFILDSVEGLMTYFSTANTANMISAQFLIQD